MCYKYIKITHSNKETQPQTPQRDKLLKEDLCKRRILEDTNFKLNEKNWREILQRNQSSDKEIRRRHLVIL